MNKIGFFTAVSFGDQSTSVVQTLIETVDSYFYLGGKKAYVIGPCFNNSPEGMTPTGLVGVLLREDTPTFTALKIASYCTVIIPVIALLAKAALRRTDTFRSLNAQNDDKHRHLFPLGVPLYAMLNSINQKGFFQKNELEPLRNLIGDNLKLNEGYISLNNLQTIKNDLINILAELDPKKLDSLETISWPNIFKNVVMLARARQKMTKTMQVWEKTGESNIIIKYAQVTRAFFSMLLKEKDFDLAIDGAREIANLQNLGGLALSDLSTLREIANQTFTELSLALLEEKDFQAATRYAEQTDSPQEIFVKIDTTIAAHVKSLLKEKKWDQALDIVRFLSKNFPQEKTDELYQQICQALLEDRQADDKTRMINRAKSLAKRRIQNQHRKDRVFYDVCKALIDEGRQDEARKAAQNISCESLRDKALAIIPPPFSYTSAQTTNQEDWLSLLVSPLPQ